MAEVPQDDGRVEPEAYALRPLGSGDVDAICRHRHEMFREIPRFAEMDLQAMQMPFRAWLVERLASGAYFGFVAEHDVRTIGGVGLLVLDWPPHPYHVAETQRGYLLNVFVEPEFRGRGIARALLAEAEREFERRGITYAVLHASPMGRPIYEAQGWKATSEMAKALRELP